MTLFELAVRSFVMGVAGSALIDAWALTLRKAFHVSSLDYRLLGRWISHFRDGQFFHSRIAGAPAARGEAALGWTAHYAIGVGFAAVLLLLTGREWAESPTVWPALAVGIGTIAAPWFVMQPAFGAGIAGSKTPHPWRGRLRNLGTHTVYGVGLFISALAISGL